MVMCGLRTTAALSFCWASHHFAAADDGKVLDDGPCEDLESAVAVAKDQTQRGVACRMHVKWAMETGYKTHKDWYTKYGISDQAKDFQDFQCAINLMSKNGNKGEGHNCPLPCTSKIIACKPSIPAVPQSIPVLSALSPLPPVPAAIPPAPAVVNPVPAVNTPAFKLGTPNFKSTEVEKDDDSLWFGLEPLVVEIAGGVLIGIALLICCCIYCNKRKSSSDKAPIKKKRALDVRPMVVEPNNAEPYNNGVSAASFLMQPNLYNSLPYPLTTNPALVQAGSAPSITYAPVQQAGTQQQMGYAAPGVAIWSK